MNHNNGQAYHNCIIHFDYIQIGDLVFSFVFLMVYLYFQIYFSNLIVTFSYHSFLYKYHSFLYKSRLFKYLKIKRKLMANLSKLQLWFCDIGAWRHCTVFITLMDGLVASINCPYCMFCCLWLLFS